MRSAHPLRAIALRYRPSGGVCSPITNLLSYALVLVYSFSKVTTNLLPYALILLYSFSKFITNLLPYALVLVYSFSKCTCFPTHLF